jgi:hypothetical protein
VPCFGQTKHSGTLFWPSSFRSQQSGFSNNSFGKFATLLVSPFGLVLFLTIFLQKSEDSFQLVFFQKDQQVSRNSPFARTQNLHSNRANLDFNTLLMFHFLASTWLLCNLSFLFFFNSCSLVPLAKDEFFSGQLQISLDIKGELP